MSACISRSKEATKPAGLLTVSQQQARFDTFVEQYNHDRPHQALAMKVPAEVYVRYLLTGRTVA